ncbi:glycosyltransferase family 2 protein [Paracoccus sp. MBLB3053]|uniref:Glycosyltransferase family 2 protein n=1 Tax=Paracoccus aurantius TaxID=3073814 RepID=A0ABU2HRN0_9RHOB|nr:glycosyltransferase family 2 protein [Paracoccus sp. MBLB3053]MDS9467692.1 glycosyltransferase family 2 protein [Paracoccus sp. MBLB3053]
MNKHTASDPLKSPTRNAGGSRPVRPRVSIVVPLRDEAENIVPLVEEIRQVLEPLCPYEILLVDDASKDGTREVCISLVTAFPGMRLICHDDPAGQSAAIHSGVRAARANLVATLDGDGQNPPAHLASLLAPFLAPASDPALGLVAGQRVGRKDSLSKRLASRFANVLRMTVLRDGTRDTGCGLKAFRQDAYLALPYFDHQHRYLPALFARDGWRIELVDVTHAARRHGRSKYGNLRRAFVGIWDLLGVAWLIRRRKRTIPREIVVNDHALGGSGQSGRAQ